MANSIDNTRSSTPTTSNDDRFAGVERGDRIGRIVVVPAQSEG